MRRTETRARLTQMVRDSQPSVIVRYHHTLGTAPEPDEAEVSARGDGTEAAFFFHSFPPGAETPRAFSQGSSSTDEWSLYGVVMVAGYDTQTVADRACEDLFDEITDMWDTERRKDPLFTALILSVAGVDGPAPWDGAPKCGAEIDFTLTLKNNRTRI